MQQLSLHSFGYAAQKELSPLPELYVLSLPAHMLPVKAAATTMGLEFNKLIQV